MPAFAGTSRGVPPLARTPRHRRAPKAAQVDNVTLARWVQRFTPLLIEAARSARHLAGDWWLGDETDVKVSRFWSYFYRAVDLHGRVIDV